MYDFRSWSWAKIVSPAMFPCHINNQDYIIDLNMTVPQANNLDLPKGRPQPLKIHQLFAP